RFNTRNLAWKVAEKFGVQGKVVQLVENIGTKIGIQGAGEVAGNFMAMAAKEGFRNAFTKAITQLASGAGKVAASGGAAATGTAVTGAAATGAAAGGGILATIASGPAAPIVAVVLMAVGKVASLFKKVKKIAGKASNFLEEKLNIRLPSIKRFVEDTLGIGGLPGKIISGGIGIASAIGGILAAPIAIGIAPVVVGVIILFFILGVGNTNKASFFVPPQTAFEGSGDGVFTIVDPIFGEDCELTLACVAYRTLTSNGLERVGEANLSTAVAILSSVIERFPMYNIARFINIMVSNVNYIRDLRGVGNGWFQCIGFSLASDPSLSLGGGWASLYAGTVPGCVKIAPENAGLGDHLVYPMTNEHYHIGVLTTVREDGSAVLTDVNGDGRGLLRQFSIMNLPEYVNGGNYTGRPLTILRCGR
ncbi:hypothetical protein KKA02_04100, partial [Patescibacteria group bacterium]|nr:hypothetical protein [Patescibacteria group bacterium]